MVGPCLCGDPYCPSCGDPSRAAWDDAIDQLVDQLDKAQLSIFELQLFTTVGLSAVEAARKAIKDQQAEAAAENMLVEASSMLGSEDAGSILDDLGNSQFREKP